MERPIKRQRKIRDKNKDAYFRFVQRKKKFTLNSEGQFDMGYCGNIFITKRINNVFFVSHVNKEIVTKEVDAESRTGARLSQIPKICLALWTMNLSCSSKVKKHLNFMYSYCTLFQITDVSDSLPELFV